MIRRLDIAFFLAALAFAIVTVASAQAPAVTDEAVLEDSEGLAPMSAIPASLTRAVLESWVAEQIDSSADADDGETRFEVSARWQGDILLDEPGVVGFDVRRLSSRPFRGPTVVRLTVTVDGRVERSMSVTVDCRHFRDVVVATRTVRRGSSLTEDFVVVEERDITSAKHGFFTDLEELVDTRAKRPIGDGGIVSQRHVEPIPVLQRGDEVTMALRSGNMSLLATGIAMQDGGIGQRIRVQNIDSRKVVYGEVVDANTVRITGG